jgi:alkanesulfonate monooxygenase SsuD/methylene tetrahydromethanopterin reductase-like flavin-dependent oxidoreductase (luciferase family)
MGGGTPDTFTQALQKLNTAWSEAGRKEKPRALALFYFALGDEAQQTARENIADYYAFLGDYASQVVDSIASSPEMVKQYLSAFAQAGADEVICFPAVAEPDQVELLGEAALG